MFISTVFFTLMQTFIKELQAVHVTQVLFFRSFVTWMFCFFGLKQKKIDLWGRNRKGLIMRAILGLISMSCFFVTLQHIPMGLSVSIKYLSPIFTALLGLFFLKEKVKPMQWIFFIIALLGTYLVKHFDSRFETVYLFIGIIGALTGGGVYVNIRYMGLSEHYLVVIQYFMLATWLVSGLGMFFYWIELDTFEIALLLIIGILGYYAQVYMTKAFQYEVVNKVSPIKYMEIIYSLLVGWMWFGETYSLLTGLGIALILSAIFFNLKVH